MRNRPRTQRSNFFWQGLLIILPAILLAAIGLFSLRQDRILAEHDALAQARRIAADLALDQFPNAIRANPVPPAEVAKFCAAPRRPAGDPIMTYALGRDSRRACLLSTNGDLIYPPPLVELPIPQPLDETELSDEQRFHWTALSNPKLAASSPAEAALAGQSFLQTQPPERFAATATYRMARLLRSGGDVARAWPLFEIVARDAPNIAGETGVALGLCAQLQLLQMAVALPQAQALKSELLSSICSRMLFEPSALSRRVLGIVAEQETYSPSNTDTESHSAELANRALPPADSNLIGVISQEWRQVWEAHAAARRLYDHLQEAMEEFADQNSDRLEGFWLNLGNDERQLITFQSVENCLWVFAQDESSVRAAVRRTLAAQTLPQYFGIEVEVAGERIMDAPNSGSILARSFGAISKDGVLKEPAARGATGLPSPFQGNEDKIGPGLVKVAVRLTDPGLLYARQRVRTFWFGSLIGASALAVIVGFAIAGRAFRRQQQLNEMKTNFVSSVSHELRAPIASVRLMAEELEDLGPQDRQKNKEYHHFIVQECRRLSALIENVLDFSRHEQGRKQYEFEPADLVALVEETVKLMQAYGVGRCIGVEAVITGVPVPVEVDGRAIQQVLVNLIDNAIKHSPASSTVTVGLEFPPASQPDSRITNHDSGSTLYAPRSDAPHVKLWVEDCGEGIPPEDHERIFERFYRRGSELRRETQGVGLGLAIVKFVTEAHGGQISVRSAPGQGSRFTVVLPARPVEDHLGKT